MIYSKTNDTYNKEDYKLFTLLELLSWISFLYSILCLNINYQKNVKMIYKIFLIQIILPLLNINNHLIFNCRKVEFYQ